MKKKKDKKWILGLSLLAGLLLDGMLRVFSGSEGNLLVHAVVFLAGAAAADGVISAVRALHKTSAQKQGGSSKPD